MATLCDSLNLAPLAQPIRRETEPIVTYWNALFTLHEFALSSDWYTALSVSVVIGKRDYIGFGYFTALDRKLL